MKKGVKSNTILILAILLKYPSFGPYFSIVPNNMISISSFTYILIILCIIPQSQK